MITLTIFYKNLLKVKNKNKEILMLLVVLVYLIKPFIMIHLFLLNNSLPRYLIQAQNI